MPRINTAPPVVYADTDVFLPDPVRQQGPRPSGLQRIRGKIEDVRGIYDAGKPLADLALRGGQGIYHTIQDSRREGVAEGEAEYQRAGGGKVDPSGWQEPSPQTIAEQRLAALKAKRDEPVSPMGRSVAGETMPGHVGSPARMGSQAWQMPDSLTVTQAPGVAGRLNAADTPEALAAAESEMAVLQGRPATAAEAAEFAAYSDFSRGLGDREPVVLGGMAADRALRSAATGRRTEDDAGVAAFGRGLDDREDAIPSPQAIAAQRLAAMRGDGPNPDVAFTDALAPAIANAGRFYGQDGNARGSSAPSGAMPAGASNPAAPFSAAARGVSARGMGVESAPSQAQGAGLEARQRFDQSAPAPQQGADPAAPQAPSQPPAPKTLADMDDAALQTLRQRVEAARARNPGEGNIWSERLHQVDREMQSRKDRAPDPDAPLEREQFHAMARGANSEQEQQAVLEAIRRVRTPLSIDSLLNPAAQQNALMQEAKGLFPSAKDAAALQNAESRAKMAEATATYRGAMADAAERKVKDLEETRDSRIGLNKSRGGLADATAAATAAESPGKISERAAREKDLGSQTKARDAKLPGELALQAADKTLKEAQARAADIRARLAKARGVGGGGARNKGAEDKLLAEAQTEKAKALAALDDNGKEDRQRLDAEVNDLSTAVIAARKVSPPVKAPKELPENPTDAQIADYNRTKALREQQIAEWNHAQAQLTVNQPLLDKAKADQKKQNADLAAARKTVTDDFAELIKVGLRIKKAKAGIPDAPVATPQGGAPASPVAPAPKAAKPATAKPKKTAEDYLD